jgi:hypothetical protein
LTSYKYSSLLFWCGTMHTMLLVLLLLRRCCRLLQQTPMNFLDHYMH